MVFILHIYNFFLSDYQNILGNINEKDYTLIANNKNKTKITFAYDHGLPYKDKVRPNLEYGDWEDEPHRNFDKN